MYSMRLHISVHDNDYKLVKVALNLSPKVANIGFPISIWKHTTRSMERQFRMKTSKVKNGHDS